MTRIGISLLLALGLAAAAWPPAAAQQELNEAEMGPGTGLTVYNGGFAIIKERRHIELPAGAGPVRFADVAGTIVPQTVQFTSLTDPTGTRVVEQNYEFDLVNAEALLQKFIDKPIGLVLRDGSVRRGTLMSWDAGQIVLSDDDGISMVPRGGNIRNLEFSRLPEGLMTRPTLAWRVKARRGGRHLVKIAYRAGGISWRVDYRVKANRELTRVNLGGWVTITNSSGATYTDARLKLMAGDVHTVAYPQLSDLVHNGRRERFKGPGGGGFQEKSFSEYHLYTLGRPSTLGDNETKQIELIDVTGIPVTMTRRTTGGGPVEVMVVFKNEKATAKGLGIPLPRGPVRVFGTDADGTEHLLHKTQIDHTPRNETVSLAVGKSIDVVSQRKITEQRRLDTYTTEYSVEVLVRNHRDDAVTVEVAEPIGASWTMLESNTEWKKDHAHMAVFPVKLAPEGETTVRYTVRVTW